MTDGLIHLDESLNIGVTIKEHRKSRGITQNELADYTGLSRAGIAKIEAGESDIKLSTLISISNLLGLDLYLRERGTKRGLKDE